ncbi:efflux RND transporter permease subunit, partial [Escherichia coli]|uniref:efflux RND transporter permease subunit n=1 Tax=Escherichia coli TaxID=562 RepID=UPI003984A9B2
MANFFIRRPIFAWVLAIILMMAGALAILQLPVAQYPTIAPPAVSVSANYPGADAQTVQDTVTQVIEQNMNGIDNLMYMNRPGFPGECFICELRLPDHRFRWKHNKLFLLL